MKDITEFLRNIGGIRGMRGIRGIRGIRDIKYPEPFFPLFPLFPLLPLLLLLTPACSEQRQTGEQLFEGPSHVRFFLLVDNNNQPLPAGQVDASLIPVEAYTHTALTSIDIPVALSLAENSVADGITVRYAVEVQGDYTGYELTPGEALSLSRSNPVDTLRLNLTERWEATDSVSFRLRLTEVDALEVGLGSPTQDGLGRELLIRLGEVQPSYALSTNRLELNGNAGEQVEFSVAFPNGFLPNDLPDTLLRAERNFDFTLERLPLQPGAQQLDYRVTLDEALDQDDLSFESTLTLLDLPGYTLQGSPELLLIKPTLVARDNSLNLAAEFYDLTDPFFRVFGHHWLDFNADDTCAWNDFFAFSFPVEVGANHPHAVLYDDQGTSDPRDDVYHHAFRVGFNSPNVGRTTNAFNLKRWFDNEATDAEDSPGFNVPEAIEFYPENGSNPDRGTMAVIEQDLLIAARSGTAYTLRIAGGGTYQRAADGTIEVQFTLSVTNQTLLGGTRTDTYRFYNYNPTQEPPPLPDACGKPIGL